MFAYQNRRFVRIEFEQLVVFNEIEQNLPFYFTLIFNNLIDLFLGPKKEFASKNPGLLKSEEVTFLLKTKCPSFPGIIATYFIVVGVKGENLISIV